MRGVRRAAHDEAANTTPSTWANDRDEQTGGNPCSALEDRTSSSTAARSSGDSDDPTSGSERTPTTSTGSTGLVANNGPTSRAREETADLS